MSANMIKFLRGNVANLPANATEGAVYFTKDEGVYLGLADGTYHRYGDFIAVSNVDALPAAGAHETCMYYCIAENILAKWNGSAWIQINKQKTLAELGGVAQSVYNAKIAALEKADTDNATAISGVDTRLQAAEEKLKSVATTDSLGDLTDRVSGAETDIENLQAAIAEGGSVANAIAAAKTAGDNAQKDVDALALKVGEVAESKTVVGLIGEAQTQANKGVTDAAAAQAKADEAYNLANGKATMAQVNEAISGAGHAVKSEVDAAIEQLGENYVAADTALETRLQGNIDKKVDQSAYDVKVAALENADTILQGNIDTLSGKVGTPTEGKTIVEMISDAQTAATYDDTAVRGLISDNAEAIEAIEADYLKTDDKTALQDQITANANAIELLTNGVSAEEVDGVNDLIQYVKDHGTEVTGMKNDIATNAKAISDHEAIAVETYETKTDATQKLADAKAYTDAEVAKDRERLAVLEAIDHDHSNKSVLDGITATKVSAWDASEQNAKDYADDAIEALGIGDYVKKVDADTAYATAGHNHDTKYDAKGAAAQALVDAKAYADTAKTDAINTAKDYTDELANGQVATNTAAIATKAAQDDLDSVAGRVTTAEGKITALETASAKHALKTEVEAVQTNLDEYETSNNAAVALKANAADVYKKTETYTRSEVDALISAAQSWGEF